MSYFKEKLFLERREIGVIKLMSKMGKDVSYLT